MKNDRDPSNKLSRRDVLRIGSLAAAGSLATRFQPAMAGPFTGADFLKLVPEDKKLSAEWIRSLTERGEPEWVSGEDLKHIGMPVGGTCCGQVYLSGDGRLWHWDIFNQNVAPKNRTAGPHYAKPMPVASAVDLGFSMRIKAGGKETVRSLDGTGFPQVRFRGAYPMGFVEFRDKDLPVIVISGQIEIKNTALEAGANAFFNKTSPPDQLLEAIQNVMENRKRRRI